MQNEKTGTRILRSAQNDRREILFLLQMAIYKTPKIVTCHLSIVNFPQDGGRAP